MLWLYIVLLVFAAVLSVAWVRYGIVEHDSFVLGAGVFQVGLGVLWTVLIIFTV